MIHSESNVCSHNYSHKPNKVVPYLCFSKESFHLIRRGKFEKSTFEFQRAYVTHLKSVIILLETDKALQEIISYRSTEPTVI